MNKLNERLTLIANLSVVAGIIFLAVERKQNTQAIQAQTRDSITEKQMTWAGWIATNRETAEVFVRGTQGTAAEMDPAERVMLTLLIGGQMREFENSHYQYEQGLFTPEEYEARASSGGVASWPIRPIRPTGRAVEKHSPLASEPRSTASWRRWVAEISITNMSGDEGGVTEGGPGGLSRVEPEYLASVRSRCQSSGSR